MNLCFRCRRPHCHTFVTMSLVTLLLSTLTVSSGAVENIVSTREVVVWRKEYFMVVFCPQTLWQVLIVVSDNL